MAHTRCLIKCGYQFQRRHWACVTGFVSSRPMQLIRRHRARRVLPGELNSHVRRLRKIRMACAENVLWAVHPFSPCNCAAVLRAIASAKAAPARTPGHHLRCLHAGGKRSQHLILPTREIYKIIDFALGQDSAHPWRLEVINLYELPERHAGKLFDIAWTFQNHLRCIVRTSKRFFSQAFRVG